MPNVNNKVKVLLFLFCIITLISTVNSTYSRYVSASEGVVSTNLARWQIFINSKNVTESYGSSITFTPIIEPNEHVAANKIAPSSKGYFDIAIDPTNVDVSFTYNINFNIPEDSIITDIKVTDYAIVDGTEITDDTQFTKNNVTSNILSNTLYYDETKPFNPFVVRVFFAWVDDENETMNDEADSSIGNMVASGDMVNFDLGVSINFKQYVGEEEEIIPDDNQDQTNDNPDDQNSTESGNIDNPTIPDDEAGNIDEPTIPDDVTGE